MGAPTQLGTTRLVGLNGKTYSGYTVEGATVRKTAEVEKIKNEDNETATRIISDPMAVLRLAMLVDSETDAEAIAIGDIASVDSVSYVVADVEVAYSRGVAKVTLTLEKEDSMSYS